MKTEDLLEELKNASDLQSFFNTHEKDFLHQTPVSYLNDLISIKGTTVAKIAKKSGVGEYLYKVFNNERKPSRDILISISLGMTLSLEEAQLLLRISKFAILDARDKRDSIIIYGIIHGLTVFEIDDVLATRNLPTIN